MYFRHSYYQLQPQSHEQPEYYKDRLRMVERQMQKRFDWATFSNNSTSWAGGCRAVNAEITVQPKPRRSIEE